MKIMNYEKISKIGMILENELKLFLAFSKTNEMYICLHQRVGVHLELLSLHAK